MWFALASCQDLPDWEVDDWPLHHQLLRRGHAVSTPAWTDASVDWSRFDAVLIRTTWDYAHQREAFVAWADRVSDQTLLMNSPAMVRWNTDKRYLSDLASKGVRTLDTVWIERGQSIDVAECVRGKGWTKGFIKPVFGATARETLRFSSDSRGFADAQAHMDRLIGEEPLMLQRYTSSVERLGERSAIVIAGCVSHAVVKRAVPGDYRVQDDHGGTDAPTELTSVERDLVNDTLAALPFPCLYVRVDMLENEEGLPCVIECEAVEPSLFFRHGAHAALALVKGMEEAVARKASLGTE
jgi:glutathione synthase/RimK-type ligase-like ATP-grasp enzyme